MLKNIIMSGFQSPITIAQAIERISKNVRNSTESRIAGTDLENSQRGKGSRRWLGF